MTRARDNTPAPNPEHPAVAQGGPEEARQAAGEGQGTRKTRSAAKAPPCVSKRAVAKKSANGAHPPPPDCTWGPELVVGTWYAVSGGKRVWWGAISRMWLPVSTMSGADEVWERAHAAARSPTVTPEEFADRLVEWVSTVTQLDPEKGELVNVEDWRRTAAKLFAEATSRQGSK